MRASKSTICVQNSSSHVTWDRTAVETVKYANVGARAKEWHKVSGSPQPNGLGTSGALGTVWCCGVHCVHPLEHGQGLGPQKAPESQNDDTTPGIGSLSEQVWTNVPMACNEGRKQQTEQWTTKTPKMQAVMANQGSGVRVDLNCSCMRIQPQL